MLIDTATRADHSSSRESSSGGEDSLCLGAEFDNVVGLFLLQVYYGYNREVCVCVCMHVYVYMRGYLEHMYVTAQRYYNNLTTQSSPENHSCGCTLINAGQRTKGRRRGRVDTPRSAL